MTERLAFEDIAVGAEFRAGPLHLTREAIIAFAQMYDPQPFHLDETAASKSLLQGLAASGWQTAAIGMRLFHEGFVRHVDSMGAPGVDELRWLRPVRPGDQLSLVINVTDKRPSSRRTDRGYVSLALAIENGAGETVMTQRGPLIVACRGATMSRQIPPSEHSVVSLSEAGPDLQLAAAFEEVEIGHVSNFGSQRFDAEAITRFAGLYDPQPFHCDAEQAKASHFGGLVASGWQTAAYWMKHYIAARRRSAEARAAAGLAYVHGGPSPGISDLKWLRPVYSGQTVGFGMVVTGKRKTARPGWAIITTHNTGRAPDGTDLISFESRILWPTAELSTSS
jgi:acyl dehydratase